jgi:hypothetical protein
MISPYVPVALSIIGAISAILSIALSWVSVTVKVAGIEIDFAEILAELTGDSKFLGPISLTSKLGQDLNGASATLAFLVAALVSHVGATGMGIFYAKSPESGKFWVVAMFEVVAVVCLVIAGIAWGANIGDNIKLVFGVLDRLDSVEGISFSFFLFSVGQGFGITSFLFAVAAAITALKVHNANKYGSMQVQAWGPATGAKPSLGGPVVAQHPYGQPQQPPQQMQMQQMSQTQQVQHRV